MNSDKLRNTVELVGIFGLLASLIFVGLELAGLSLYILAGFDKTDDRSAEASLKYFLFGGVASAFTLFGLSLVYGMTGSTRIEGIAEALGGGTIEPLLAAGLVMLLVAAELANESPGVLNTMARSTGDRVLRAAVGDDAVENLHRHEFLGW